MQTHTNKAAGFFVQAFGVTILAISAVTTFSFFSTYFSAIFPKDMLGVELASLLAGGAGVVLFDLACVYWLNTFLKHAETPEQRGIALIMVVFTFCGAAAASIAQLGLSASGDIALDQNTRQSIANVAVWTVIAGVVANFGANNAYARFSLDSKERVREADRRDLIQGAHDEQELLLTDLISQEVKTLIAEQAPQLAKQQAARLVASFQQKELSRYAGRGDSLQLPANTQSNERRGYRRLTSPPQMTGVDHYYLEELVNGRWVPTDITGTADGTYDDMIHMTRGVWRQVQDDGHHVGQIFYADQAAQYQDEVGAANRRARIDNDPTNDHVQVYAYDLNGNGNGNGANFTNGNGNH